MAQKPFICVEDVIRGADSTIGEHSEDLMHISGHTLRNSQTIAKTMKLITEHNENLGESTSGCTVAESALQ